MTYNTFEANNISSMVGDQIYTVANLHNMHTENLHAGQFMSCSFMLYLQQFIWIMTFFKWMCFNSKIFLLEYALPSLLDPFIDVSSKLPPLLDFQHCVSPTSLNLITFQNIRFSLPLLRRPIWCLYIQPSPIILTFICDQILSGIATSIIFDIAKEGIQDKDYNSPIIDKMLHEFQF